MRSLLKGICAMHPGSICAELLLLLLTCLPLLSGHLLAEEPALPSGLSMEAAEPLDTEPALPSGLMGTEEKSLPLDSDEDSDFLLSGFAETRGGLRYQQDPYQKRASIGESRLQIKADQQSDTFALRATADFVADTVANDWPLNLESGTGFIDLRELHALYRPGDIADVKIGRQILTWGTGDFIFINDLFPKDWNSFFNGRDDDYLKAPSDSLKIATFTDILNFDLIYSPRFDSDRYIDGDPFSFYSPATGHIIGGSGALPADQRSEYLNEDEWFARAYTDVSSYEIALYGYSGYWKSPAGFNVQSGQATFPKLNVYGASIRGPLAAGIANGEFGFYDSREDRTGTEPFINNSELRFLVGYEQELLPELTGGFQYYLEKLLDYSAYQDSIGSSATLRDEYRQLITLRLTKLLMNQNLRLSFFSFYSPTDRDAFLRGKVNYILSDRLQAEVGTNIFLGEHQDTFFGMFEDASNFFVALRYSFVLPG